MLDWLPGIGHDTRHYECRQCGHTLDCEQSQCPVCQADEIATYRI
jgi:rubrerythrin